MTILEGAFENQTDRISPEGTMSRIPQRTMDWSVRGKRNIREAGRATSFNLENTKSSYSFGNPECFDELHSIAVKFSEEQLKLADSTGFGLFARSRIRARFDKAFCTWLLGRVDCAKQCINLPSGGTLSFFPEDVRSVYGVPNSGIVPWHFSLDKTSKTLGDILRRLGHSDSRSSCISAAEGVLRQSLSDAVSVDDVSFRIAFVVYVMGVISDAKRSTHFESQNYLPALKDVSVCSTFDWARCILEDVVAMCREAQADDKKKMEPCPPAGCLLFLQIFYLDNIDYGSKSIQNRDVPRVLQFSPETISALIIADCVGLNGTPPKRVFGSAKPRPIGSVVYRRTVAAGQSSMAASVCGRQETETRHAASKAREVVNEDVDIYTKVVVNAFKAKCLKHLTTARLAIETETDDLMEQLKRASINRPKKNIDLYDKRIHDEEVFVFGGLTTPPPACSPTTNENEIGIVRKVETSKKIAAAVYKGTPHNMAGVPSPSKSPPKKTRRHSEHRKPLHEIGNIGSSFVTAMRAIEVIDIDKDAARNVRAADWKKPKEAKPGVFAKAWWTAHEGPPRRNSWEALEFYRWAIGGSKSTERSLLSSTWVQHGVPKPIKLVGEDLVAQLRPGGQLASVTIDLIIRSIYLFETNNSKKVWRHFLESDFAETLLNGDDYLGSDIIWGQFAGDHIKHDLSHCQMILCMAFISNNWTGLCWDLKRRQITAFAPGHYVDATKNVGSWALHSKAIDALHDGLQKCINTFFTGWSVSWDNWTKVLLQCCSPGKKQSVDNWVESAVLAIQFLRTFDGVSHMAQLTEVVGTSNSRAELLYDAVHVIGNDVAVPVAL